MRSTVNLLALDTATQACSVALARDGRITERWRRAPREHAQQLLPMVEEVLTEAGISRDQIDVLAYGRGPGSFTGLRIATGLVQGLALALNKPVVPVSVLAALAYNAFQKTPADYACAALDARMDEVYWGIFNRGAGDIPEPIVEESVLAPERVGLPIDTADWAAIGGGWDVYRARLTRRCGTPDWRIEHGLPHAGDIATLALTGLERGDAIDAQAVQPVYLRNRVAAR